MSTLFAAGMSLLTTGLRAAAGVSVAYARGGATATLTAWVGRTVFSREPTDPGGAAVVWGDRDYLIPVADLTAAGFGAPQKGDRITEAGAGTFELMNTDTGEPPWRFSDQTRLVYRLHVKKVS